MLIISGVWDGKWEDCSPGSSPLPGPTCVPEPAGWKRKELWFASFDRLPEIILATVRNHIRISFCFPEQRCYIGSNIGSSSGKPRCHAALPAPLSCLGKASAIWAEDSARIAQSQHGSHLIISTGTLEKWPEVHPSVIVLNAKLFKIHDKKNVHYYICKYVIYN